MKKTKNKIQLKNGIGENVVELFFDNNGNLLKESNFLKGSPKKMSKEEINKNPENRIIYKNKNMKTVAFLRFAGPDWEIHEDSFIRTIEKKYKKDQ